MWRQWRTFKGSWLNSENSEATKESTHWRALSSMDTLIVDGALKRAPILVQTLTFLTVSSTLWCFIQHVVMNQTTELCTSYSLIWFFFRTIPIYFVWLKYVSWFTYANEILVVNQWRHITSIGELDHNIITIGQLMYTRVNCLFGVGFKCWFVNNFKSVGVIWSFNVRRQLQYSRIFNRKRT